MNKFQPETILWKFESKWGNFGFLIPNERSYYGGDFFVNIKNFNGAQDGDPVRGETIQGKGKKPEVRILEVVSRKPLKNEKTVLKTVEGVYSWGNGDFGFVDVEWEEQWYFIYGKKKNGARDGDRVRAEIVKYNGKQEGIVVEILWGSDVIISWKYSDNDKFGFVLPDDKSGDVFIAGSKKGEAQNGDKVQVKIIKEWGRRREWVIVEVI